MNRIDMDAIALPFENGWREGLREYGEIAWQYARIAFLSLAAFGFLYVAINASQSFAAGLSLVIGLPVALWGLLPFFERFRLLHKPNSVDRVRRQPFLQAPQLTMGERAIEHQGSENDRQTTNIWRVALWRTRPNIPLSHRYLLAMLDKDSEIARQKYERIRESLLFYFRTRSLDAERLVGKTFSLGMSRLRRYSMVVDDLNGFFLSIARIVEREHASPKGSGEQIIEKRMTEYFKSGIVDDPSYIKEYLGSISQEEWNILIAYVEGDTTVSTRVAHIRRKLRRAEIEIARRVSKRPPQE